MMDYKRITIHFNMKDPHERELYYHTRSQDKVVSRYLKRLVDYDRKGLIRDGKDPR